MPVCRGMLRLCGAFTVRPCGARNNNGGFFVAFPPAISKDAAKRLSAGSTYTC